MAVGGHWSGQLALVYGLVASEQLVTFSMLDSGHWSGQLALIYELVASVRLVTFSMAVSGHRSGQLQPLSMGWLLVYSWSHFLWQLVDIWSGQLALVYGLVAIVYS
jgi:hypothetical protein